MALESDNEKTEAPSQKRLDEAVERGDVAKSQEVNTWFIMGGAALVLMVFAVRGRRWALTSLAAGTTFGQADGTTKL